MRCIAHNIDYCIPCNSWPTIKPFSTSFEGYTANPEDPQQWPNSVSVEAVEGTGPTLETGVSDVETDYADVADVRQLVEIDTNYKPGRKSEHPVRLTRAAAVKLAAALLEATDDTFHYTRCGPLRPSEAKELLYALSAVEYQLTEIREHALGDLLVGVGLAGDSDEATEPSATDSIASVPVHPDSLAGAIAAMFPAVAADMKDSPVFGLLNGAVSRVCREQGITARQVFESIDVADREFAQCHSVDAASFLLRRLTEQEGR
ncbi:hypothetical protein [Amycolatopsis sp. NPDC059657]|uniref:hypothetical protein n=1 Tax=Amycolatopsis sp. NPDC059657 TaxID=3346899 RepID=UPI00366F31C8